MKIAIVGSGISGLSTAYLLSPHAQVTVYEKEDRIGGHANTALIKNNGQEIRVDTGFMVFNPERYPYFIKLISRLGVASVETDMSFSVSIPRVVEYSSFISGLFGDLAQLAKPRYWVFLFHILKFNNSAKKFLKQPEKSTISLGEFIEKNNFSQELVQWYLYPMLGCIWSSGFGEVENFPAQETLRFLDNHRLLNTFNRPKWRTIQGGSTSYVYKLVEQLKKEGVVFHTRKPVNSVRRVGDAVEVESESHQQQYDYVVMASHADETLDILKNPTKQEEQVLGKFSYTRNVTVLHSDTSYMPKRKQAWASWNYFTQGNNTTRESISLTYWMNNLQGLSTQLPVLITLNPKRTIDKKYIHETYNYSHPHFNQQAREAQDQLHTIQGTQRILFAGAHWGYGFHEDGVVSAIDVLRALDLENRLDYE